MGFARSRCGREGVFPVYQGAALSDACTPLWRVEIRLASPERGLAVGIARTAAWNGSGTPFPGGNVRPDEADGVDTRFGEAPHDLGEHLRTHDLKLLGPRRGDRTSTRLNSSH